MRPALLLLSAAGLSLPGCVPHPAPPVAAAEPVQLPDPSVRVRPLPASERRPIPAGATKAQIIEAVWVDKTVVYTPLGLVDWPDGPALAHPASFSCQVTARELTVSYTREGFDAVGLPDEGSCSVGAGVVRFRIELESTMDL